MSPETIATLRPKLRPEIVLGPEIVSRGTSVHYVKDGITNWFYRIGTREHFLVSRMDGSRTLQEIDEEYAAYSGKHMSASDWNIVLSLLGKRKLLVGYITQAELSALEQARQKKRRKQQGIFRARLALVNPDAFLGNILPWLRFTFHPTFVYPALATIIALEIFFFSHLDLIVKDVLVGFQTGTMIHGWSILTIILLVVITLVLHEFAHGLTCKRFGGSVHEMGIGWRYLSPFPYCKLDDVLLFQNRWHRVYAAFAGVFINLLMLVPFALLWYLTPEQQTLRIFCSYTLLSINVLSLLNLIPFIELDGYLIITYALNMTDLRKDAHALYLSRMKHLFIKSATPIRYEQRSSTYLIYGAFSLLFTSVFIVYMIFYWFLLFSHWGATPTAGVLYLTAILVFLLFSKPGRDWMQKRREESQEKYAQKRRENEIKRV